MSNNRCEVRRPAVGRDTPRRAETWSRPGHTAAGGTIVVVTAEDERFGGALRRATEIAAARHEPLLLYDWEAPSLVTDPLPTRSSDGSDEVADRLDPEQLDAAGRPAIADLVRRARSTGVEAFGWLPSDTGPAGLAEYAVGQRASMIVIPRDLDALDSLDAVVNDTVRPAEEPESRVSAAVVVV